MKVNCVGLRPTWTFTNASPPILEPFSSQDMLYPDLISSINSAQQQGLNIGIYPTPHFPADMSSWWQIPNRDYYWWVSFFERYSNFILHHASVASTTNAATLILGGDWLDPALPGGHRVDGSSSNVPQDAETRRRGVLFQ